MPYYAVKIGKNPGIYNTWSECQKNISGFSGAKFHKFETIDDSNKYMNEEEYNMNHYKENDSNKINYPCAFVDGSYNGKKELVGSGIVFKVNINSDEKRIIQTFDASDGTEAKISRNIYGEIKACIEAINLAKSLNLTEINIYYDYLGIELWFTGQWKVGKPKEYLTEYLNIAKEIKEGNKLKVNFYKVSAHTGIKENEIADKLAKIGAGFEIN